MDKIIGVVSVDLAKQLKKAEYPQDKSTFYWCLSGERWILLLNHLFDVKNARPGIIRAEPCDRGIEYIPREFEKEYREFCAAPTVAELGEALPIGYFTRRCVNVWVAENYPLRWDPSINLSAPTEADARAKMWLYLKEKGLL